MAMLQNAMRAAAPRSTKRTGGLANLMLGMNQAGDDPAGAMQSPTPGVPLMGTADNVGSDTMPPPDAGPSGFTKLGPGRRIEHDETFLRPPDAVRFTGGRMNIGPGERWPTGGPTAEGGPMGPSYRSVTPAGRASVPSGGSAGLGGGGGLAAMLMRLYGGAGEQGGTGIADPEEQRRRRMQMQGVGQSALSALMGMRR